MVSRSDSSVKTAHTLGVMGFDLQRPYALDYNFRRVFENDSGPLKRHVHLTSERVWQGKSTCFFICPSCSPPVELEEMSPTGDREHSRGSIEILRAHGSSGKAMTVGLKAGAKCRPNFLLKNREKGIKIFCLFYMMKGSWERIKEIIQGTRQKK